MPSSDMTTNIGKTHLSYRSGPPHHILVILAVFTSEIVVLLGNNYARQKTQNLFQLSSQKTTFWLFSLQMWDPSLTRRDLLVLGKIPVHIVVVVLAVAGALRELSHVVVHLLTRQLGVRSWKNNEETIWKWEISINQHKKIWGYKYRQLSWGLEKTKTEIALYMINQCFRIRIQIQWGPWVRIRIRIQEGKNDPLNIEKS